MTENGKKINKDNFATSFSGRVYITILQSINQYNIAIASTKLFVKKVRGGVFVDPASHFFGIHIATYLKSCLALYSALK